MTRDLQCRLAVVGEVDLRIEWNAGVFAGELRYYLPCLKVSVVAQFRACVCFQV